MSIYQSNTRELAQLGPGRQTRGPGGRFSPRAASAPSEVPELPKPAEAAPEPAQAILDRIEALCRENGGVPVAKPPGIDGAAYVRGQPNKACLIAIKWLETIAEVGRPGDVETAWYLWRPNTVGEAYPKTRLHDRLDGWKAKAGRRCAELRKRAEAEALPGKIRERRERGLRELRAREAEAAAELAKRQAAVAKAEASA